MFIRSQKIKRDDKGKIISGSATICKTVYDPMQKSGHSSKKVIEKLGKVLWLNENNTEGIFLSPLRGLVSYNSTMDSFVSVDTSDPRLKDTIYENTESIHTTFGDVYLLLSVLGEGCLLDVLRDMSSPRIEYQRLLAHLLHDVLRNGRKIKCREFLETSMASYVLSDISRSTLDCDASFFLNMGNDSVKISFFSSFVEHMRKERPNFGRACYVDSTPIPNDIRDNPYNALCSHGTDGAMIQTRLALVLDIETNLPVWFHVFPACVLDHSTIMDIAKDVKASIDVDIIDAILDAGYACKELFERYHIPSEDEINGNLTQEGFALVRMPARNGYPYDELYLECKSIFFDIDYLFDYKGHSYFGKQFTKTCLGYSEYCYVFLNQDEATNLGRHWRQTHPDEWALLSRHDKEWYRVKDGFFILVGNKNTQPQNVLIDYRDRVKIELVFKTMKDLENLLSLGKWNATRVKGKLLMDVIELIASRFFREALSVTGLEIPSLLVQLQSLDCFKSDTNQISIYTPKSNVREIYEKVGYQIPGHLDLNAFKEEVLHGVPMDRVPIKTTKKRASKKKKLKSSSPEEKANTRLLKKALSLAQKIYDKSLKDADTIYTRSIKKASAKYEKALEQAKKSQSKILNSTATTDSEKTKANEIYKSVVDKALNTYNSQIVEAGNECEAKKRVAKEDYEKKVKSLYEQYGYKSG